jgi:hypothetical protein
LGLESFPLKQGPFRGKIRLLPRTIFNFLEGKPPEMPA